MSAYLDIPPGARTDKQASELIRAWAAHGGLQCSLNVDAWSGDQTTIGWGILLSDIARHVSNALYERRQLDRAKTLAQIQKVFNEPKEYLGFIMPKNSMHGANINEFFESGFGFTSTKVYHQILEKYLGYEIIESVEIK